jgi:glucose-6-phosphate dehydrogenase assembly protein OpcA
MSRPVLVPLIAPDLPVVLWCRDRALSWTVLDPLFPLANKIIFNTRACGIRFRYSSSAAHA